MHRNPLQELPLERYVPHPAPKHTNGPFKVSTSPFKAARPAKRPLSPGPGAPILFSPTKRRILNEEGIFSPEKTVKTFVASRGISDLNSPARRLDFGKLKNGRISDAAPIASTSRTTRSMTRLASSPKLSATRTSLPSTTCSSPIKVDQPEDNLSSFSSRPVPRELPPLPNPHSVHYPGFLVYQDAYVFDSSNQEDVDMEDGEGSIVRDKEGQKENLRPRRKTRKAPAPSTASDLKAILSPSAKEPDVVYAKSLYGPVTPKKTGLFLGERQNTTSPTPRRMVVDGGTELNHRVWASPVAFVKEGERKERRKALMDEANDDIEDEDLIFQPRF